MWLWGSRVVSVYRLHSLRVAAAVADSYSVTPARPCAPLGSMGELALVCAPRMQVPARRTPR